MVRLLDGISYNSIPKENVGSVQPIAYYSEMYDGWAQFQSTETLSHFVKPRMPQDLALEYEAWVAQHSRRPPETTPFGIKSLDYIIEACLKSENADELLDCQVVTKGGILLKLSKEKGGISMDVSLIDGRLFIEEHDSQSDKSRLNPLMHIEHAFKEACTTGSRHGDWSTVVSRKIGNITVLFGAQVDCIKDEHADHRQSTNFIQLKTMKDKDRSKKSTGAEWKNWHTIGGWYMQAYLLGIPSIFIGYRHCKGGKEILLETETRPIKTLLPPPESSHLFDPARSIGRIHFILSTLLEFTKTQHKQQEDADKVKVWRATISVKGALDVVEVPPEERVDGIERIGIVKRELVENIREIRRLSDITPLW